MVIGRTFEGIIDISADRKILAAELKKDLDVIKGVPWQISIIEKLDDNT
ncbi:MAG: hypothetical protein VB133_13290 [Anaeromusa sp.]|nr:hypothetical protein [Anaeromusa sp.]MEA4836093.1 hypothetical protein [Anaeromusa sp.]